MAKTYNIYIYITSMTCCFLLTCLYLQYGYYNILSLSFTEIILFNGRFKFFLVISVTICGPRKQHHMGGLSPNTLSISDVLLAVRFKTKQSLKLCPYQEFKFKICNTSLTTSCQAHKHSTTLNYSTKKH